MTNRKTTRLVPLRIWLEVPASLSVASHMDTETPNDELSRFTATHCDNQRGRILFKDFYDRFVCTLSNEQKRPTKKWLSKQLRQRGFNVRRGRANKVVIEGLEWRAHPCTGEHALAV